MDMARSLMFERNLPNNLWAEAVNTTAYLQNKLPTKAVLDKTPFEVCLGLNLILHTKKSLVASAMHMFHLSRGTNWKRRLN